MLPALPPSFQDEIMSSQTLTDELCLIFTGSCVPRAGRMRRVVLGAKKIEMAGIRFPCSRSRLKTAKKENFNSCGEATNFQGTFSGVSFRPLSELPLIKMNEKEKVLASAVPAVTAVPQAPDAWRDAHGEDLPLFWQEGKPISLFLAILDEFKIKAVFDCTVGTGALMEACLTRGVLYHGLCLNRDHLSWVQAVADRAACGLASIQGSTLYSEELSKSVKEVFDDVLRSLIPQNGDVEEPMEPESDQDA